MAAVAAATAAEKPHIVTIIADDFGWANVGYHHAVPSPEVVSPTLDKLAASGRKLTRHYAFKLCSPSRSAFQTGRTPVHVNDANAEPTVYNPNDRVGGYAGIPVNMTGIASKMRLAGYATAMTGKWDAGMATPAHTPRGRGYDSWFGYFHHANDYWTQKITLFSTGKEDVCLDRFVDLWGPHDAPALSQNGTAYEEELFTNHTIATILQHDASVPLFLVHAFHIVHTPLQLPAVDITRFNFIKYHDRRMYAALVHYMDGAVARIVDALVTKTMWPRTLLLFTSDNGGPIYRFGGANNYPLKGGKFSDWEGGVRVAAFVAGGALPAKVAGKPLNALIHIADWYATFCSLAGIDPSDVQAAAAGLPPVDGIDMWPALTSEVADGGSGGGSSSGGGGGGVVGGGRTEVHLSKQALIVGKMKILIGTQFMSGWTGPSYPNATGPQPNPPFASAFQLQLWGHDCGDGCLYDIFADPTEHHDLAASQPEILTKLRSRLQELNKQNYDPDRGRGDPRACQQAVANGGFYGPWLDLPRVS